MIKHSLFSKLFERFQEPRRFIQVLSGPRQVGKTQLALQIKEALSYPSYYATADSPTLRDFSWIEQEWETARTGCHQYGKALLILDEIQKLPQWSEVVKRLWDEDTADNIQLQVLLLGSSPLLMQQGLTESLAGRFEIIPMTQWSFIEMHSAFNFDLKQYIFFGGYPGSAALINDVERWRNYINDALIETTISRDILLMKRVDKPALLRRLFHFGCRYSGQIFSLQKMLGQLQDSGNATTIAHYLELLSGAGLLTGISKFSNAVIRQKASSPKLQVLTTALISATNPIDFLTAQNNKDYWGRLVEATIGAHLLNSVKGKSIEVFYWRERDKEVDFVLRRGNFVTAIEVKTGHKHDHLPGMGLFAKEFNPQRKLLIGNHGIDLQTFLETPILEWVS